MKTQPNDNLANRIQQSDPETYEQYILIALDRDPELWQQMSPLLCKDTSSPYNPDVNDFDSVMHYGLYLALRDWKNKVLDAGLPLEPINEGGMLASLYSQALKPRPVVVEDKLDTYAQLWRTLSMVISTTDAISTVKNTWKTWLIGKKAQRKVLHINRTDGQDATEQLHALTQETQAINAAGTDTGFDTILDIINSPASKPVERFPLSPHTWSALNESTGGGFGRGEHALIIAPSGGGKTVIACQIAAEMAYAGKNVLFVSTEEPLERVLPRFVSAMSYNSMTKIPYAQVKGKPAFNEYLPPKQLDLAMSVATRLHAHILYKDWTGGKGMEKQARSYNIEDLDLEVENAKRVFESRGEKLDMVILDWLGATLRKGVSDSHMLRTIYYTAATRMKDIAVHYDVATISLAQATAESVKKVRIDNTCVAECHALHDQATVAIGISHLADGGTNEGEKKATFRELQCFNVFKSRSGIPMVFWMKENFDYMRFDAP